METVMNDNQGLDVQEERNVLIFKKLKDDLFQLKKDLSGIMSKLTLEVSELEDHNTSALEMLKQASSQIQETVEKATVESQPVLTKLIKESLAEPFSAMKQEVSSLSKKLEGAYRERESSLTTKGVLVTISFCLGSMLTGAGLWYFFPQHVSVNQSLTDWQLKGLRDGAMFRHAFKKLAKKEQQALEKKMWDSYDDWFNEFLEKTK